MPLPPLDPKKSVDTRHNSRMKGKGPLDSEVEPLSRIHSIDEPPEANRTPGPSEIRSLSLSTSGCMEGAHWSEMEPRAEAHCSAAHDQP